jgi:hypothetical protein
MLKTRIIIALLLVFVLPTILAQIPPIPPMRPMGPDYDKPEKSSYGEPQVVAPSMATSMDTAPRPSSSVSVNQGGELAQQKNQSAILKISPFVATPLKAIDMTTKTETTNPNRTITEIYFSLAILFFGMILAIMEILVVIRKGTGWDIESVRLLGLTLVITVGAFLIPAGYSQEQIAPLVALLGTIVGYLLGRDSSPPQGTS